MVYHVSRKYLLHKILEPFFITFFWPFSIYLTSQFANIGMSEELIYQIKIFTIIIFLITIVIAIINIYFLKNTVLVIDKNGIIYRVRDKVTKFTWTDLSRVEIYKSKRKIISIVLFPYRSKLRVYCFDRMDNFINDIESHGKNKINIIY
ncbi:TPA: hypothetical protein NKV88_004108 [Vibrio parahaemolyticus]|uniref:hypothetical protein n=1 Tax=Vibrio parahaemolyticus TaxID=670 RepID=UPI000462F83E|nr:hypothetical protein [Vibrio parahaemolyticus]MBE4066582.1 hypothetical protein [Vibrio parahaemolyticus]MBE4800752.1 hypothetical protein [Vibrio parahaemolyticus]HCH4150749.1 hypothetical protein [Vibrio parahaemolyticus]